MHISVISLSAWADGGSGYGAGACQVDLPGCHVPRVQVMRIEEWHTQERSKLESIVDSNACMIPVRVDDQ